jgi:hypothetical protein
MAGNKRTEYLEDKSRLSQDRRQLGKAQPEKNPIIKRNDKTNGTIKKSFRLF